MSVGCCRLSAAGAPIDQTGTSWSSLPEHRLHFPQPQPTPTSTISDFAHILSHLLSALSKPWLVSLLSIWPSFTVIHLAEGRFCHASAAPSPSVPHHRCIVLSMCRGDTTRTHFACLLLMPNSLSTLSKPRLYSPQHHTSLSILPSRPSSQTGFPSPNRFSCFSSNYIPLWTPVLKSPVSV